MATVKTYLVAIGCGVLLLGAVSTHAGESLNGIAVNGLSMNGISINGLSSNGLTSNGLTTNGINLNGSTLNGLALNGSSLNGAQLNGQTLNGLSLNGTTLQGLTANGVALNGLGNQGLLIKETRRTEGPTSAVQSESLPCEHDRQCTLAVQSESLPFNGLSQRGLGKTHPQANSVHMSFVSSYLNIYCALARAASVPILCGLI